MANFDSEGVSKPHGFIGWAHDFNRLCAFLRDDSFLIHNKEDTLFVRSEEGLFSRDDTLVEEGQLEFMGLQNIHSIELQYILFTRHNWAHWMCVQIDSSWEVILTNYSDQHRDFDWTCFMCYER